MPHHSFIRTLRAQWLGQRLRELREQRGLTLKLVAEHLGRDLSALGRYERAEWPIGRGDVVALLDLFGFHDASERARILGLAEDVWRTHRWDVDRGDVVNASFIDFGWLASRAERICMYEGLVVPALLQTREYASTLIRCFQGPTTAQAHITRLVDLRLERQRVLDEPGALKVQAVVEESALRRRIGDAPLIRAQLEHLNRLRERPHVDLRVMPARVGLHPGLDGSFWLFRMRQPYPPVGFVESRVGRLYMEEPIATPFASAYDRLLQLALSSRESGDAIAAIIESL
jgi:hypothetical protein